MALENLKKEMLASIDQYKGFVETELESVDAYIAALNANESKLYFLLEYINAMMLRLVHSS